MTRKLLAKGANIDAKTVDGETPLYIAVYWGKKDLVELLLVKGADINVKNKNGETPLGKAVEDKKNDIVALLKKHGAKQAPK